MKQINQFINKYIVKKKLDKPINSEDHYEYYPETKQELIKNIQELLNKNIHNFNCIDTSAITDMSKLFCNEGFEKIKFKGKSIENWDISNVENMAGIFYKCKKLNCDLSNWNVSKVEIMDYMFKGCYNFKGKGLENWDVSKVKHMKHMFYNCYEFKGNGLENWNVSNVKDMREIFYGCSLIENKPSWYKE